MTITRRVAQGFVSFAAGATLLAFLAIAAAVFVHASERPQCAHVGAITLAALANVENLAVRQITPKMMLYIQKIYKPDPEIFPKHDRGLLVIRPDYSGIFWTGMGETVCGEGADVPPEQMPALVKLLNESEGLKVAAYTPTKAKPRTRFKKPRKYRTRYSRKVTRASVQPTQPAAPLGRTMERP